MMLDMTREQKWKLQEMFRKRFLDHGREVDQNPYVFLRETTRDFLQSPIDDSTGHDQDELQVVVPIIRAYLRVPHTIDIGPAAENPQVSRAIDELYLSPEDSIHRLAEEHDLTPKECKNELLYRLYRIRDSPRITPSTLVIDPSKKSIVDMIEMSIDPWDSLPNIGSTSLYTTAGTNEFRGPEDMEYILRQYPGASVLEHEGTLWSHKQPSHPAHSVTIFYTSEAAETARRRGSLSRAYPLEKEFHGGIPPQYEVRQIGANAELKP